MKITPHPHTPRVIFGKIYHSKFFLSLTDTHYLATCFSFISLVIRHLWQKWSYEKRRDSGYSCRGTQFSMTGKPWQQAVTAWSHEHEVGRSHFLCTPEDNGVRLENPKARPQRHISSSKAPSPKGSITLSTSVPHLGTKLSNPWAFVGLFIIKSENNLMR